MLGLALLVRNFFPLPLYYSVYDALLYITSLRLL
jgi:hypothetical protein